MASGSSKLLRGALNRNAPSRSGAQLPWLQLILADPRLTGNRRGPVPVGARSGTGKFAKPLPSEQVRGGARAVQVCNPDRAGAEVARVDLVRHGSIATPAGLASLPNRSEGVPEPSRLRDPDRPQS